MVWPNLKMLLTLSKSKGMGMGMGTAVEKYDTTTGQVFTETIMAIQGDPNRDWAWNRTQLGYPALLRYYYAPSIPRPRKGASSLKRIALGVAIKYAKELTLETVQTLYQGNQLLVELLWEEFLVRQAVTLHIWQIFATVLKDSNYLRLGGLRYRYQIPIPKSSLATYTRPLVSLNLDFLVNLSITTSVFTVYELVHLSDIPNLTALEVVFADEPANSIVTDRLIGAWSDAAKNGAFSVLRILRLWNHLALTAESIKSLKNFPLLAIFDPRGCAMAEAAKIDARKLGWTPSMYTNIAARLEAGCMERALKYQNMLCKFPVPLGRPAAQQYPDNTLVARIPRSDVKEFLTGPLFQRPPTPPEEIAPNRRPDADETIQHVRGSAHGMGVGKAWEGVDLHLHRPLRAAQAWDFPVVQIFNRIGELRHDKDFSRAGVKIGELQPIAGTELISAAPLISLRLGPDRTCHEFNFENDGHRLFYGSIDVDHTTSKAAKNSLPLLKLARTAEDFSPTLANLSFYRISFKNEEDKPPSLLSKILGTKKSGLERVKSESKPEKEEEKERKHTLKHVKSELKPEKKRKIGDVLSSFMQ